MNFPAIAVLALLAAANPPAGVGAADPNAIAPAEKWEDVARELLDMPAPPRDWKEVVTPWSAEHQPPDDAPLDVLLAFYGSGDWQYREDGTPRPSATVQARLLEAVIEKPERFAAFMAFLPETPEAFARLKALYDKLGTMKPSSAKYWCGTVPGDGDPITESRREIRNWLIVHSLCFRDELIDCAKSMRRLPKPGVRPGIFEIAPDALSPLPILARLDWKTAEPILSQHADGNSPEYAAEAMTLLYRHAIDAGDQAGADAFRLRLRKLADDPDAEGEAKRQAVKALIKPSWPGRDEWFASLFAREDWGCNTLAEAMYEDPNGLIPIVGKLVANKDDATRDNAIESLLPPVRQGIFDEETSQPDVPPAEALKPLLPWLTDPNWYFYEPSRKILIEALSEVDLPEAAAGLLYVLRNEAELRGAAVRALARQKAKQAGPEMWRLFEKGALWPHMQLPRLAGPQDMVLAEAMIACSAAPDERFAEAAEAYICRAMAEPNSVPATGWGQLHPPLPVRLGYGWVPEGEPADASGEEPRPLSPEDRFALLGGELLTMCQPLPPRLAELLAARTRELRDKEPRVAQAILVALAESTSPAIDRELTAALERSADMAIVLCALTRLDPMRENVPRELAQLAAGGGPSAGVAAAVLADANACRDILRGNDRPAQLMLLACARLIRTPLAVDDVAAIWKPRDKLLALACERYIESEDSPAAREVIWSRHSKRPPILGARWSFASNTDFWRGTVSDEQRLARRVRAKDGPDEIFAVIGLPFGGSRAPRWTIECKDGRRTLTAKDCWTGDWSREMTDEEFGRLKALIDQYNFEDLPPLPHQATDGTAYEYLHLTRRTGVRVYMDNPGSGESAATPYHMLMQFFGQLDPPADRTSPRAKP